MLQSLALDRRTIEREIRSCRVVFRFLLFNFFPLALARARARLASLSIYLSLSPLFFHKTRFSILALCLSLRSLYSPLSLALRANLFILDHIREVLDMRYIRHAIARATRFINNSVLFYVRFIFAHDMTHCSRTSREDAFINGILFDKSLGLEFVAYRKSKPSLSSASRSNR